MRLSVCTKRLYESEMECCTRRTVVDGKLRLRYHFVLVACFVMEIIPFLSFAVPSFLLLLSFVHSLFTAMAKKINHEKNECTQMYRVMFISMKSQKVVYWQVLQAQKRACE